ISSHAKFCHSCATPIVVEQQLGEETELTCPVCETRPKLVNRRFSDSDTAVSECPSCAGIWISHSLFEKAVRTSQERSVAAVAAGRQGETSKVHAVKMRKQEGPMYRKCPECETIMNRQNYARRSGIIIDVCRQHGIWFDRDELDALLEWIREGGDNGRSSSYVPSSTSVRVMDHEGAPDRARKTVGWEKPSLTPSRSSFTPFDVAETVTDLLWELFR
ncbi:MAG: zf-TFIIB domain-containing protein, partial [Myxococcota bacterium]